MHECTLLCRDGPGLDSLPRTVRIKIKYVMSTEMDDVVTCHPPAELLDSMQLHAFHHLIAISRNLNVFLAHLSQSRPTALSI